MKSRNDKLKEKREKKKIEKRKERPLHKGEKRVTDEGQDKDTHTHTHTHQKSHTQTSHDGAAFGLVCDALSTLSTHTASKSFLKHITNSRASLGTSEEMWALPRASE